MKLPLSWLKEYVKWNVTPEEFVEKLMWRGFEVASYETEMSDIEGVVVARILSLEKHPNADKLLVCSMDIGEAEPVTIVTGAPNVFEGALVPAALSGARLAGGVTIKPTVMRGVESRGMLCSGGELGLTDADYEGASVNGIMILREEHPLGQDIRAALGKDDVVFEIELTPNRADCQSIIGMCREAAAALGQKFTEPQIKSVRGEGNAADYASVTVLNSDLCPRYTARVVTDLKIAPSPAWMQKKLRSVGLRPINNIVDITNYVLVEYGHPMHAFDLACVAGGHIIVRNAAQGETVTTLDGKERSVTPEMLLIADTEKGVGIAGVMGGLNSEITESTKATLFESAVFKASNIRATTRTLRHATDASACFTKGVEAVNARLALDRAIELVAELGAGRVVGDVMDVCADDISERVIRVDSAHVNRILNTAISVKDMADMLESINISSVTDGDTLVITVPHFRTDIESGIEADWDIAEEIGRIYGYYNIEPALMEGRTFRGRIGTDFKNEDALKDAMVSEGCYEMYNYNFTGPAALEALRLPKESEKRLAVKLLNPFGEDQSLMRTTLIPGVLDTVARNASRRTGHGRFFEVGNVHFDNNPDLPEERKLLGVAYTGEGESFFTLKGSIEALFDRFGAGAEFKAGGGEYFQPGQKAEIFISGDRIGEMGAIHPAVQEKWGIPGRVYYAELSVAALMAHAKTARTYVPLPRFPVVARDIAVVVDEKVSSADVLKVINTARLKVILENAALFDVYRGPGILPGKKSLAYSFTLRADDHTLNEEEIQTAMAQVVRSLQARLKAELRG